MPAVLNDTVVVETEVESLSTTSLTFKQILKNSTGRVCATALVKVVATNKEGHLYKKLPELLAKPFQSSIHSAI